MNELGIPSFVSPSFFERGGFCNIQQLVRERYDEQWLICKPCIRRFKQFFLTKSSKHCQNILFSSYLVTKTVIFIADRKMLSIQDNLAIFSNNKSTQWHVHGHSFSIISLATTQLVALSIQTCSTFNGSTLRITSFKMLKMYSLVLTCPLVSTDFKNTEPYIDDAITFIMGPFLVLVQPSLTIVHPLTFVIN